MRFLAPSFLWLAALAVLPVILYLFRRKSKTVRVSTLVFFKSLAREHREAAWLRRLKKMLSLLLTLLILLGGVAALSRIVFSPDSEDARSVVLLVDRSASMAATSDLGETRLAEAKRRLKARLDALPEAVPVSLVAYDSRPEVVQPKTTNRRAVERALEALELRPVEDDWEAAVAAAVPIARLDTPAQIWHVTDRGEEEVEAAEGEVEVVRAEVFPEGVSEVLVEVGLGEAVNVGITAFQIRPVPLQHGKYEAYLQVALSSGAPEAIEAELSFTVGEGIPVPRRFDLEPGGRTGLVQTLEGGEDQILRMRVSVAGDRFALDDVVVTRLPEVRPVTVMWVGPEGRRDPFTGVVLGAIATEGELDVWKATPEQWPPADVPDVVLFDGWVPEEWPAEIPAVVLNPPGASGPVRAVAIPSGGVPHELVRVTNEEHPLLFRVSSGRVALTQTSVIDTSGSLEPLWFAGSEPVLAAGEVGGQRLVLMAFSPQRSEQLPLTASYPLLIGNAIYWCAEGSGADGRPLDAKTGTVVDAGESGILSWRELRDGGLVDTSQVVPGRLAELDRLGLWETGDGRQGSAMLLSRHETNLGGASAGGSEAEAPGGGVGFASVLRGEVTAWLLGLVLVVLLVESWLFHRHSVY